MPVPPEFTAAWSDAEWVKAILGGIAAILGSVGTWAIFKQRREDKHGPRPVSPVDAIAMSEGRIIGRISEVERRMIGLHEEREEEARRAHEKLVRIEDRTARH